MTGYKTVIITNTFNRNEIYECTTIDGYKKHLINNPSMCESIGGFKQKIKPVFDIDAYDNDINIESIKTQINKLFPNKEINYASRKPRLDTKKDQIKYSYRFYVNGVKIYSEQIKKLMQMSPSIPNGFNMNCT